MGYSDFDMRRARKKNPERERNNVDGKEKRKKGEKFEDEQDRLDVLCLTINGANNYYNAFFKFISSFDCAKFNGKSNVLRLYPHLTSTKAMSFRGNHQDSLFIHKHRKYYMYASPHFVFVNPADGRCLTEFISQQRFLARAIEKVAMVADQTVRSHDGYCIERFDNSKFSFYKLLGDCLNKSNDNVFILNLFFKFIDDIQSTFIDTNYLPYMIHPDRLILPITDSEAPPTDIKLASLNLFSFIIAPQNDEKKILNATFSHPMSFLENKENDAAKKINSSLCFIVLDFFHSAFVTALWILTSHQFQYLSRIRRNSFNSLVSIEMKREKLDRIKDCWKYCDNEFGFCHSFEKKRRAIHRFGCLHLMKIFPRALEKAIDDSYKCSSFDELVKCVGGNIKVFKDFLVDITKEDENDDDEEDGKN